MIAVVRGNDFRLRIPIRRNVVHNNGTTSYEPLDISALNDLHVFLEVETMCAKELSWFIDTENASSIIADVPACMQEGKYALILLGKYSDDRRFRSKERKQLRLVETNEKANVTPFDLDGFDAYALDTMIVMDGRGRDGLSAYEIAVAHGYEGTEEEWIESLHHVSDADKERWNSKQDALTFDNTPTANSDNPVKSKGIKGYVDAAIEALRSLFSTKRVVFYPYASDRDTETGYIEGYAEYSSGSELKKGVRIKGYSGYNQGRSEISFTEYDYNNSPTYANIDVGYLNIYAGEMSTVSLTDADIDFDGNPATINSSDTLTVASDNGDLNLNGTNVKINGTNINTIKNNAQNALNKINAMYPGQDNGMQVKTPGIYYAYPDFGNPNLIPSSMSHSTFTGYLLLVTTVEEVDIHGGYRHLHQLIIDIVTGRKATRMINYPYDSTIDWSAAPNFTEV